jgi:two-component system OmpR family sensor kinase/two-component system sensor histidine kinase BaeS
MSETAPTEQEQREWHRGMRFLPVALFLILVIFLFIGGIAALLYWAFTEYTNFRSVWVLGCCLPVLVIVGGLGTVYSLYSRYGRPLQQIFGAIDSVSEGDLSVRVPDDSSPQFGELITRFNKMVGDLERADKQRRDLTADIAHELRSPLHIIQGKLEGMQDGVYTANAQHIGDALDETRLLARLVDDLQTLSLAESGQLPLHKTQVVLGELLRDAANSFAAQADIAKVGLVTTTGGLALVLNADSQRLGQVLANLISNALRYTSAGGVISLAGEAIQPGRVRITVRDTGSGIPAKDLPFIFDRFWRGEKARTRDGHANSGLGLAISRQLILAHGGTIEARSDVGRGTEFVIELPVA